MTLYYANTPGMMHYPMPSWSQLPKVTGTSLPTSPEDWASRIFQCSKKIEAAARTRNAQLASTKLAAILALRTPTLNAHIMIF